MNYNQGFFDFLSLLFKLHLVFFHFFFSTFCFLCAIYGVEYKENDKFWFWKRLSVTFEFLLKEGNEREGVLG